MTLDSHPSYPNPTIREALCELRFVSEVNKFAKQYGDFLKLTMDTYSYLEAHIDQILAISVPDTSETVQRYLPQARSRFVLRHNLRNVIVQIVPGAVTLNVLPPYLGWNTMEQDILSIWELVNQSFKPSQITGITMRYIDGIPHPTDHYEAEGWLLHSEYIPQAVFQTKPPFSTRVQTGSKFGDYTVLSITSERISTNLNGMMLIDFERTDNSLAIEDINNVKHIINVLHNDIWNLFSSIKGTYWDQMLQGIPVGGE